MYSRSLWTCNFPLTSVKSKTISIFKTYFFHFIIQEPTHIYLTLHVLNADYIFRCLHLSLFGRVEWQLQFVRQHFLQLHFVRLDLHSPTKIEFPISHFPTKKYLPAICPITYVCMYIHIVRPKFAFLLFVPLHFVLLHFVRLNTQCPTKNYLPVICVTAFLYTLSEPDVILRT
jgi:hypothetical protein